MKISGIICEYNPFHNGHLYHINETRKNGATHIVAVMSGNFVQRGDVAVINKFERAKAAVRCTRRLYSAIGKNELQGGRKNEI